MSEDGEVMRKAREEQQTRRATRLPVRTAEILALRELGYEVVEITPYQFRVNGELDLYPIHHRFCLLKRKWGYMKNLRGSYVPFHLARQIVRILAK